VAAAARNPLQGPATGLMTLSPRLAGGGGGGDAYPNDEIAAMRSILDEVVAHLRMLRLASGGARLTLSDGVTCHAYHVVSDVVGVS